MFDVVFGWRLWQGQRWLWALLALGLGGFAALVLLLLQLWPHLHYPLPSWVSTQGAVATVHRIDARGHYAKSSNAELYRLQQVAGVQQLAIVQLQQSSLRIAEQELEQIHTAYYQSSLLEVLGLTDAFAHVSSDGAVLSHWLWVALGKPALQTSEVLVRKSGRRYVIQGVLPAGMDRFGTERPGLWLPWEERFAPFLQFDQERSTSSVGPKALAFAENLPHSIAFIAVADFADLTELSQAYQQRAVEWLGQQDYRMSEDDHTAVLLAGVELFPEQRQQLSRQFWLLLCFSVVCAAVVGLNLMLSFISQFSQRQHELGMRQVLGATSGRLAWQCAVEQLPLILTSGVLGVICFGYVQQQLTQLSLFEQYFGAAGMPFHWQYAVCAGLVIVLFLQVCAQLPLLWLLRGQLMFRQRQGQQSKVQIRLAYAQFVLQLSFAAVALVLGLSMQQHLQRQQQQIRPWQAFEEVELTFETGIQPDIAVQQGALNPRYPQQTLAASSFMRAFETEIQYQWGRQQLQQFVMGQAISANYLAVLNTQVLAGSTVLEPHTVVINQALADALLESDQPYSQLIGRRLQYSEGVFKDVTIAGVVANLPHAGVASASQLRLYLPLTPTAWGGYRQLWLIAPPAALEQRVLELEDWADRQGQRVEVRYLGTLAAQLTAANEAYWLFSRIAFALALLIAMFAAWCLYVQLRVQFTSQQQQLGTQLAVGATAQRLLWQTFGRYAGLALGSSVLTAGIAMLLFPWLQRMIAAPVFDWHAVMPSLCILLAVVALATLLPLGLLLRRPIALLLQGRVT